MVAGLIRWYRTETSRCAYCGKLRQAGLLCHVAILRTSKNWRDFQANLKPLTPKQQGDSFELLTKHYLQLDPTYKMKLKHVWFVKEVPPETRRHLNLPDSDEGIDLVAETKEGEYWAIQCKYRTDETGSLSSSRTEHFYRLASKWTADAVTGIGRATRWSVTRRGGAVSLVERKSGYLLLGLDGDLHAPTVCGIAAEKFCALPPALRKTLTLDNGKEFADHERLASEALLKVYFADPYCAWQRGTNENTNGLIRQFFPKGTDLARIPEHRFTKVQQLLNDRPRKRLGYRTPSEILSSRLLAFQT